MKYMYMHSKKVCCALITVESLCNNIDKRKRYRQKYYLLKKIDHDTLQFANEVSKVLPNVQTLGPCLHSFSKLPVLLL